MKDKTWFPIVYMFAATFFFSSILITLSYFTKDKVEANQRIALEKAILQSLGLNTSLKMPTAQIHKMYTDKIRPPTKNTAGAYIYIENNNVAGYALPIEGRGFWDKIKGVIGMRPDMKTITGISFYEQNETPGLGAEIAQLPFRKQFENKKIAMDGQPFDIKPPGSDLTENSVHAVTGATQTSRRLEKIINEHLSQWRDKIFAGDTR